MPRPGLKTKGIPIEVTPDDYVFCACIDTEPKIMQKIYRLRFRGPGKLRLYNFELSNAKLKFRASFKRPNKGTKNVGLTANIQGNGEICLDEGEGPGVADDEGAGITGGDSDTGTDADGGGASPGSEPSENYSGPITTLCVRFWKLPGAPDLEEAALDDWLREVNAIFGGSGVRFERSKAEIEQSQTVGKEVDSHCIDVYVGGPNQLPGDAGGNTRTSGKASDKKVISDVGADDAFNKASGGLGEHITLESGHTSTTFAHELGHFLGLGPAPGPDASPQEHLDPTDGKPITDPGRLMKPANAGTKLTERERRIARAAAKHLAEQMTGCDETGFHFDTPDDGTEYAFHRVGLTSNPRHPEIAAFGTKPFDVASTHWRLDVQVRQPGKEERPWSVRYAWDSDSWCIESTAPTSSASDALTPPGFMIDLGPGTTPTGSPGSKTGIAVDIPKNHFGFELGQVEVRCRIGRPGCWQTFPSEGWQTMDLTPPGFVVDLKPGSRSLCAPRCGVLFLRGTAWATSTYSGEVELGISLPGRCQRLNLPLLKLPIPVPATWEAEVNLPAGVPAGHHECWLEAACHICGTRTSRRFILDVHDD